MSQTYLTDTSIAKRYNSSVRTIYNWRRDPDLGFPKPIKINDRYLTPVEGPDGLDAFDGRMAIPSSHSEGRHAA